VAVLADAGLAAVEPEEPEEEDAESDDEEPADDPESDLAPLSLLLEPASADLSELPLSVR
jgi:hypothetical protein